MEVVIDSISEENIKVLIKSAEPRQGNNEHKDVGRRIGGGNQRIRKSFTKENKFTVVGVKKGWRGLIREKMVKKCGVVKD